MPYFLAQVIYVVRLKAGMAGISAQKLKSFGPFVQKLLLIFIKCICLGLFDQAFP
jgi:hypothetical protein